MQPSKKGGDQDFMMDLFRPNRHHEGCGCGEGQPLSPIGVVPFGAEHRPLAEEALERREEVIRFVLPKLRELTAALTGFNSRGGIGPGEIEILGALQRWMLELQVEEDALRLDRIGPADPAP
jgi:hypothetical protein